MKRRVGGFENSVPEELFARKVRKASTVARHNFISFLIAITSSERHTLGVGEFAEIDTKGGLAVTQSPPQRDSQWRSRNEFGSSRKLARPQAPGASSRSIASMAATCGTSAPATSSSNGGKGENGTGRWRGTRPAKHWKRSAARQTNS